MNRRALCLLALLVAAPVADTCTRAVYFGKGGQTVTGRSMDWLEDMRSNLWAFPRGMKRDGGLGEKSLTWTSQYGSVVTSVYEAGTADGMNEEGLVANLLYLAETEYPPANDPRPAVIVAAWTQYALDNFATVNEAVAEFKKGAFRVVPTDAPERREGDGPPRGLRRLGRLGDFRVSQKEARHPPRPRVPGDDQLAGVRPATGAERLLEADRRHGDAAGDEPRRRPLRAGVVLRQRLPAVGQPA